MVGAAVVVEGCGVVGVAVVVEGCGVVGVAVVVTPGGSQMNVSSQLYPDGQSASVSQGRSSSGT
ncbi:MAG: hypothetical protein AB7G88_06530, partial [Thermomicrobiales bacterium]